MELKNRLPAHYQPPEPRPEESTQDFLLRFQDFLRHKMQDPTPLELKEQADKLRRAVLKRVYRYPISKRGAVWTRESKKMIKKYDKCVVEYLAKEWGRRT